MNIDERLEKLTERHEALAQSLELMAAMSRDNDARATARMDKLEARISAQTANIDKLATIVRGMVEVSRDHERRITGLEG